MRQILILQKKTVRIINFQPSSSHKSLLYNQNFILKFQDKIFLKNILFVNKSLNNLSPAIFNIWLSFSSDQHNYETSGSTQGSLMEVFYHTNRYRRYSATVSAVELWNKIQNQLKRILLKDLFAKIS